MGLMIVALFKTLITVIFILIVLLPMVFIGDSKFMNEYLDKRMHKWQSKR